MLSPWSLILACPVSPTPDPALFKPAAMRIYRSPRPGPTALATAMALSGIGENGFVFAGFLPHKSGGRERELKRWRISYPRYLLRIPLPLLKLMGEIEQHLAPDRIVFVARELTKNTKNNQGTPPKFSALSKPQRQR